MRIRYVYKGEEKTLDSPTAAVVIGRAKPGSVAVDLDLSPDMAVSRPHAQICYDSGQFWVEDLGSGHGTRVDGDDIRGKGRVALTEKSEIRIGQTALFVAAPLLIDNVTISPILQAREPVALGAAAQDGGSASSPLATPTTLIGGLPVPFDPAEPAASRHQRLLYELLLYFGTDTPLDQLLQFAVDRLVAAVPAAQRGALLLRESGGAGLLLKAHLPPGQPAISTTLAEHAMQCGGGFIWRRGNDLNVVSESMMTLQIAEGIYAPLTWRGETFGVICVDNCDSSYEFAETDLELVVAAGQHIALAIANYQLREDLRRNAALIERLLTNFSPSIRRRLLEKARHGRLKLGGEKSEVTILTSDIRGFTKTSAAMDAVDIVDMLNSYFSALVSAIFRHDGTVDKFIGDAILAVFGSPEPDPDQHAKAVRAALAMQVAIAEVNCARQARGQIVCEMGIGIHCGEALHGFIGSEERMEFTVIGDAVNRTARYCDGAGPGQVLISPEMYQRVWNLVHAAQTAIKTKHEGSVPAYRIDGLRDRLTSSATLVVPQGQQAASRDDPNSSGSTLM
ncbi:MAG TPA: adenylate/guanylate cyclase domain-containing protein [Pirellulales bacterium]|nr:adenylate/guanylate cyclase domain-containing protein [Pirellulales bacterium]